MQRSLRTFLTSLALAGLFTFLFHNTGIGLNLLLFEAALFAAIAAQGRVRNDRLSRLVVGAVFATAVAVVLHGSTLAITANILFGVWAVGVLLAPAIHALHQSLALALWNALAAPRAWLRSVPWPRSLEPALGITPRVAITTGLVPLVILLFVLIYRASNPYFDKLIVDGWALLPALDAAIPFLFVLGILIAAFALTGVRQEKWMRTFLLRKDALDQPTDPVEAREERMRRSEIRTGVLLLAVLNVLLLVANALDIQHVWLGFRFEGQYLKQFVHEGTYLLIISMLLGAAIVLYYFRGDLNFHRHNRTLRMLSYAWLAQNLVLALSVGMRNQHYIQHYALAYKRIGVAFFLLAVIAVLTLVIIKVHRRRSHHHLIRWSTLAIYCTALLMAVFDWDTIIARYNMAQRERAFVHLDFLATLSDRTLPYLTRSQLELENLDAFNQQLLGGEERYDRALYMTPRSFAHAIHTRTEHFLEVYPQRSWRSWCLADSRAYAVLKDALGAKGPAS